MALIGISALCQLLAALKSDEELIFFIFLFFFAFEVLTGLIFKPCFPLKNPIFFSLPAERRSSDKHDLHTDDISDPSSRLVWGTAAPVWLHAENN